MDFLKIGKNKLKIGLTRDDLRKFKLEDINADTDLSSYKRALFKIIDIAEEKCCFYTGRDKLLIQFYPIPSGGEMFVTRLSILTEAQRNIISKAENLTTLSRSHRAYFFDNINDAISLSKSICSRQLPPEASALYITENGSAVLDIEEYMEGENSGEYAVISEFADPLTNNFFIYLREHSIPVYATNAVKELSLL